jgi:hypothetical protein
MTPRVETTVTVDDRELRKRVVIEVSDGRTWRECPRCHFLFIGESREDDCGGCS